MSFYPALNEELKQNEDRQTYMPSFKNGISKKIERKNSSKAFSMFLKNLYLTVDIF